MVPAEGGRREPSVPAARGCGKGRVRAAAQRLLDLAWEWIGKDIRSALALSPPSYRDSQLGDLGKPIAAVLAAAAAIGWPGRATPLPITSGNRTRR